MTESGHEVRRGEIEKSLLASRKRGVVAWIVILFFSLSGLSTVAAETGAAGLSAYLLCQDSAGPIKETGKLEQAGACCILCAADFGDGALLRVPRATRRVDVSYIPELGPTGAYVGAATTRQTGWLSVRSTRAPPAFSRSDVFTSK